MADAPAVPARPMKYPYTFTAKIAQFPFKFYMKNNFLARWYIVGFFAAAPVFIKISNMANSPENVAKWAEIRRKQAEEHH